MSSASDVAKLMFAWLVAMGLLIFVILLDPFGILPDQVFTADCEPQYSDSAVLSFVLTDEAKPEFPAFLTQQEISERLVVVSHAIEAYAGPIVIWVHGFRTDTETAVCLGGRLKDTFGGQTAESPGPKVIAFSWPAHFKSHQFSKAQRHADVAAGHLARLLDRIDTGRVTLITHSLGAQIALQALQMSENVRTSPIANLVLVQAAVPHSSIRSWEGERRVTFPQVVGAPPREPISEPIGPASGCYFWALSRAKEVIITSSRRDSVLSGAFASSTDIFQRCFGPVTLGNQINMNNMPGSHALGLPFSAPSPTCMATEEWTLGAYENAPVNRMGGGWHADDTVRALPEATGFTPGAGSVCTSVQFRLPRDDIDFFDLDAHRFLVLGYRHNPLLHPHLRDVIVQRIGLWPRD